MREQIHQTGTGDESVIAKVEMSDAEFGQISTLVYERIGINLSDAKKTMLQARLAKRLRHLGMRSFASYCSYLFSPMGMRDEMEELINAVTTNKTDFFREPHHFEFLTQKAVPSILHKGLLNHRPLRVWSAACSTGMEPYTLAMVLAEAADQGGFTFSVLGTDISTKVLQKAMDAVYTEEDIQPVPLRLRERHLLRSRDRARGLVRMNKAMRNLVEVRQMNLKDARYPFTHTFEIVFCRNVIIYFDRQTQADLLSRIYRFITPGGYLFLGHAESLNGISLPLKAVAPTVFEKPLGAE